MTRDSATPVRPAATVVVLRPVEGALLADTPFEAAPFEVLMVRRSDHVAFMAGAHVFPGGRVDDTDDAQPAAACDGIDGVGRMTDLTPADEARHRVAAIRELLEEAGVLLARDLTGAMADAATAAAVRATILTPGRFVSRVVDHQLRLALDAVMPFAHWVTPDIEIRRFDTRFLLARMPHGQQASSDGGETTALEWLAPREALARAERGEIKLPPPTWVTLMRLASFRSIDEAWQWAATTPIPRIQPGFVRNGEIATVTVTTEAGAQRASGSDAAAEIRFELIDGLGWRPIKG